MSTRRALAYSFLDRYAALLLSIASSMFVARLLTPGEIGVFSVTMVLIGFISTLRDLGAGQYLVQTAELTPQRIRATWTVLLTMGVVIGLLVLAAAYPVSLFYREPRMLDIMLVIALNFLVNPFGSMTYAWLMREMRFDALAVMRFGSSLAGAGVSVYLSWRGHGPISLAFGNLAATLVNALLAVRFRPAHFAWWPGFAGVREVLGFGSKISANSLVLTLATGAPELLLGKLQSLVAAGLYSRGYGLATMFQRLMLDAVQAVALPLYARAQREDGKLNEPLLRTLSYITALGWSFFVGLALLAYPLTRALYGGQWDASVDVTRWLAMGMAIGLPAAMCPQALMAAGRPGLMLRTTMTVVAIQVACIAAGAIKGLNGAAAGFAVAQLFALPIWLAVTKRQLGFEWRALRAVLRRSAALAAAVSLAPLAVVAAFGLQPVVRVAPLACALIGGVLLFVLVAKWLQHPISAELQRVAQGAKARS